MKRITVVVLLLALGWFHSASAQTLQDVKRAIEAEEYKTAIDISNKLITASPKVAENYFYKGLALYKSVSHEDVSQEQRTQGLNAARDVFNLGKEKNSRSPYSFVGLGLYAAVTDKFAEAKTDFDKALELSTNDADLLVEMAKANMEIYKNPKADKTIKNDALNQAEKLLTRAEGVNKKNSDIYITLGDIYKLRKVDELTESNYKKALAIDANYAPARYALAKLYIKQKKYNEGKDELLAVVKLDEKFAPAYKDLCDLYYKINEFKYAKIYAEKYKNLMGTDKAGRVRYAQLLYLINDFEGAVPELKAVLKDTSGYVLTRLLAYSLYESKQYPEAKTQIDALFGMIKPTDIIFKDYKYAALINAQAGDVAGAEKNLQKTLELAPEEIALYKDFYTLYETKKDYPNAVKFLTTYVQKTQSLQDEFNLGWNYYVRIKDFNKADSVLKNVATKKPEIIDAHLYLARANAKLDPDSKQGRAKTHYENFITQATAQAKQEKYKKELIEANSYLGYYFYDISKDFPKSMHYNLSVQELDPENANAKKIVDYLKGQNVKAEKLPADKLVNTQK